MNSKLYCINPNTKEYEEVKTIYGINIEEILDLIRDYKMSKDLKFDKFGKLEEIEKLNQALKDTKETADEIIIEQQKKIERLNDRIEKDKILIKEANDRAYSEFEENVKLGNENSSLRFENRKLHSIIKEARECINEKLDINSDYVDYDFGTELLRQELLEILQGSDKE